MISLIILGIIFLYAIISYNTLTRKRNNVDNAFGSIDVMLKKRFDLIPNLVATVHTRNTKKRHLLKSQIYGRRVTTPSQLKKKQILTKHSLLLKIISLW